MQYTTFHGNPSKYMHLNMLAVWAMVGVILEQNIEVSRKRWAQMLFLLKRPGAYT